MSSEEAGPPRAVLIDLDDTLVPWQTPAHWQWAWLPRGPVLNERRTRAAIRRALHAWDRRRWQGIVGAAPPADASAYRAHLRETLLAIADRPLPDPEVEAVVTRFLLPAHEAEMFPEAAAALGLLGERKIPVGVVTALPAASGRRALQRAGLPESLPLLAEEGEGPGLPAAKAFRAAAARLGAKPAETLYLGDLYWSDVRAAARAGLRAVWVDRSPGPPKASGPRIRSLAELPSLLVAAPPPAPEAAPDVPPDGPEP